MTRLKTFGIDVSATKEKDDAFARQTRKLAG